MSANRPARATTRAQRREGERAVQAMARQQKSRKKKTASSEPSLMRRGGRATVSEILRLRIMASFLSFT